MKEAAIILLLFVVSKILLCQDIPANYENTGKRNENTAYLRTKWFLVERSYPYKEIPANAYKNAFNRKIQLRNSYKSNRTFNKPWVPLGPDPGTFDNWGNVTGKINAVKIDPLNPQIIYAASANGGVWKSVNAGVSWSQMLNEDEMPTLSSGALAIDPVNSNIIYYGTGEATSEFQFAYYGRGIFKSTDGGVSWNQYNEGFPDPSYVSRIIINPDNHNIILAACVSNHLNLASGTGVYRSTNGGQSWHKIVPGICNDIIFMPGNPEIVFISGPSPGGQFWEDGVGFRISTDGGKSFSGNRLSGIWGRSHISVCRTNPAKLYLARAKNYFQVNIFIYDFLNEQWHTGDTVFDAQTDFNFFLYADPFKPNLVYLGLIDLYKSVDYGMHFKNLTRCYIDENSAVHADQHNMDFHPYKHNQFILTNDGGLYKTSNEGDSWESSFKGLNISQIYRLAVDPFNEENIYCGTTDNGLQRIISTQLNWQGIRAGDYGTIICSKNTRGFVIGSVCSEGEEIPEISYNGGNTWYLPGGSLPTGNRSWIAQIIEHPSSEGVFYFAKQRVWKTTNHGNAWIPVSPEIPGTPVIQRMEIDFSSIPPKFYAATGSYPFPQQNTQAIYYIFEGSNEWLDITNGLPNRYITCIAVNKNSVNEILITMSGFAPGNSGQNVFRSSDFGSSWENISASLPNTPVNYLLIHPDPQTGKTAYIAASDVGVYYTDSKEINWAELGSGLPNSVCMHLTTSDTSKNLYAATFGRGAWVISLNDLFNPGSESGNNPPNGYLLKQNFPNPFNPVTNITFQIPVLATVNISVYDVLGRLIRNVVNKLYPAGIHSVEFNGSDLNSGVYFYKIKAGNFSDAKKMILIK